MARHVEYTDGVLKQLKKMDRFDAKLITSWKGKNLEGCDDPRIHGKGLEGNRSGEWRYRVGVYLILCMISDAVLLVAALSIGHRRAAHELGVVWPGCASV